MRIYLELKNEESSKFWEAVVEGKRLKIRFGKIGSAGQTKPKEFDSEEDAKTEAEKTAAKKRKEGYRDAETSSHAAPAPAPAKAAHLGDLDDVLPSDPPDGGNLFLDAIVASDHEIHDLGLRAILTQSREVGSDGGGNIWHKHAPGCGGSALALCVDHETGEIFKVVPWVVFETAYDDGDPKAKYEDDEDALEALIKKKGGKTFDQARAELDRLWSRTWWLTALLRGDDEEADRLEPDASDPNEIERPVFAELPAFSLYWLWRAWFFKDDVMLAKVLPAAQASKIRLIRDAAALVASLQAGKGELAGVDLLAARERFQKTVDALRARATRKANPPPATDESALRARVRFLKMAKSAVYSPNLPQYLALERLDMPESPLPEIPASIGALRELRFLRCSDHRLRTLPREIGQLSKLEALLLSGRTSGDPFEAPDELGHLESLKELDLSHTLAAVLPTSLGHLAKLETLDISYNGLKALPEEWGGMKALRSLNLTSNPFDAAPEILRGMTSLETLRLGEIPLTHSVASSLPSLRELEVVLPADEDAAKALVAGIAALPSLERLSLVVRGACPEALESLKIKDLALRIYGQHPDTDSVVARACSMKSLEGLAVETRLETMTVDRRLELVAKLPRLKRLAFAAQPLTWHLPPTLGALSALEALSLPGWDLHDLPPAFGELTRLKKLDLSWNSSLDASGVMERLTALEELNWEHVSSGFPQGAEKLGNLQVLRCSNSKVKGLAADWSAWQRLRVLDLISSGLDEPESAILASELPKLESLEELGLGTRVDPGKALARIGTLQKLRKLDLTYCQLTKLPDAVGELASLEELSLKSNPKLKLEQAFKVIARMPKLKRLSLVNLNLRSLPASLEALSRLERLELASNRLEGGESKRARFSLPDTEVLF